MPPKRSKPGPHKLESPLDARKRENAEEEARNRAAREQCERTIKEGPARAEKLAQARREEIAARASRPEQRRTAPASLPDPRHLIEVTAPAPPRRLRAERRQGRLHFFLLLLLLLGLAYWLFLALAHS